LERETSVLSLLFSDQSAFYPLPVLVFLSLAVDEDGGTLCCFSSSFLLEERLPYDRQRCAGLFLFFSLHHEME